MKRILSIFICFMLVITCIPSITFAADNYTLDFSFDKNLVKPCDTLHITAKCDAPGLSSLTLSFANNRAKIEGGTNGKDANLSCTSEGVFEGDLVIDEYYVNGTFELIGMSSNVSLSNVKVKKSTFDVTEGSDDITAPVVKKIDMKILVMVI